MQARYRGALTAALLAVASAALISAPADAAAGFSFTRYQGGDRFGTAQAIALGTFTTAPTVLLARGDLFPDALAGSYLAGSTGEGAPILLTRTESLPQSTIDAMSALGTTNAILLGGPNAISPAVEAQLRARNITPERIGGATRFDTAQLVAERRGPANVGTVDGVKTAMVTTGRNFADALAGGGGAYAGKLPMLLTEPGFLSPQTRNGLNNLGVRNVWLLGGPNAVAAQVENEIRAMGITVQRVAGATRQGTARDLVLLARQELGFNDTHIDLARGDDFADALAMGPHGGEARSGLLLTGNPTTLHPTTRDALVADSATLTVGHIAGGLAAVSQAVQDEATVAATGTAPADRSTVTASNTTVQPGGTVSGTITGQNISGVTVSGCGLASQAVTRSANGGFTLTIPASQPAGSCTLTFVTTFTDNTTETDTVAITVSQAPSNQAYAVSGAPAQQEINTARTCQATVPSGATVAIMLLPKANVTTGTNNQILFRDAVDTPPTNEADQTATSARVTSVNGTAITPTQRVDSTTSSGTVTFTISSTASEEVVAVVFANPTTTGNNVLDLTPPTTGSNNNPKPAAEAFGVGCTTTFVPVEAATGASTATVATTNPAGDSFTSTGPPPAGNSPAATYNYDASDTFQYQGAGINMTQFEGALSAGDTLTVAYNPDPAGVSTFNITQDNVQAATNAVATAASFDGGATNNDVKVTFTIPTGNGTGTSWKVQRGAVAALGTDNACGPGTVADPAHADTPPATWTDVAGPVSTTTDANGVTTGTATDFNVANGCYHYRVVATNAGTNQTSNTVATNGGEPALGQSVRVPGAGDNDAPQITAVYASDTSNVTVADATDRHRFIFNEPMDPSTAATGANYAVVDPDGTTANITCGTASTQCVLNAGTETFAGDCAAGCKPNTVMVVTLGTMSPSGGTNLSLVYPLTITATSVTMRDAAQNQLVLTPGDKDIERNTNYPEVIAI